MPCTNPYKLSMLLWDINKQNVESDQDLHILLAECSIKIWIKLKSISQQALKQKWTCAVDNV